MTGMKQMMIVVVTGLLYAGCAAGAALAAEASGLEEEKAVAAGVLGRIDAYHKGAPKNGQVLHVVYFHPADVAPQRAFRERITRIMLDIQSFYRDGMKRHGYGERVFPLDITGGKLRIHVVKGADAAKGYRFEDGRKVHAEVLRALAPAIRLDRDFVLIFGGMCTKLAKNKYFFYAPYYGDRSSNHRHGLCYVADCELMDTKLLTDTKTVIRFEEHYGKFRKTLAAFNSSYIGGIAHELGHGLSLPHNREKPWEQAQFGTALMGAGNHTYRREKWDGKGSFMTAATCLRLAAHPLFTGSSRGRDVRVECKPTELSFASRGKELVIEGKLKTNAPAGGVIAYTDPEGRAAYDALTSIAEVKDGAFKIVAGGHRPGSYDLRLVVCHVSGATTTFKFRYRADRDGKPDAAALNSGRLEKQNSGKAK